MKQLLILMTVAVLAMSFVSASDSYLSEDQLSMAYSDVRVIDYCITDAGGQQNIDVVVTDVCRDTNSIYGCQAADDSSAGLFAVTANPTVINDGECAELTLTTTIADPADGGLFYFTVNGEVVGEAIGTEETGLVAVPEFGILAAFGVLGLAGLFISRKRK